MALVMSVTSSDPRRCIKRKSIGNVTSDGGDSACVTCVLVTCDNGSVGGVGWRRTPNNANQSVLALLQTICGGDTADSIVRQLKLPTKNGLKTCACVVHLVLLQYFGIIRRPLCADLLLVIMGCPVITNRTKGKVDLYERLRDVSLNLGTAREIPCGPQPDDAQGKSRAQSVSRIPSTAVPPPCQPRFPSRASRNLSACTISKDPH
ncbi:hypothetical protein J6590_059902 [Homalodisca vitripennis]|nr:hypothetical protein J6590_059902 [Homalodisca vitripennis]